jgi:hypothetical protein
MFRARMSWLLVGFAYCLPAPAADPTPEQLAHFETKVRPVLVEHCYSCHSAAAKKLKGGLRVDGRQFLLTGGDDGPAIVPGDPAKSKLIEAVRYTNTDLLMPPKGKLPEAAVRDLEAWVTAGAPWPVETAKATTKDDFDLAKRKAAHWAWQPLSSSGEPRPPGNGGITTPLPGGRGSSDRIDQFIREALHKKGLTSAPPADKLTLLRRVTFALTGLPPTPDEIAAFQKDDSPNAFEKVVDRLLASPHFGERWGRHWLDLVRYAESRGHEFEPDIPNAHQYRDYVARALNADVPYNRFVLEHLAGDVLPEPRLSKDGANESVIGAGFWHLGEEVHSPVDIRQDQADRFDNRIDVATKTFLGLTVSCARCHDHKFDAISTKDYYALFGLLEGATYRQVRIDGWKQNREVAAELAKLRAEHLGPFDQITAPTPPVLPTGAKVVVDYANLKPGEWLPDDVTFGASPVKAGTCRVSGGKVVIEPRTAAVLDPFWANLKLAPNTALDHGPLGKLARAGFTIRTPSFMLEKKKLHYLVRGGGLSFAAVGQPSVIAGPLHGSLVLPFKNDAKYRWVSQDVSGYVGQRLHVELTADPKASFAVAMVIQSDDDPPPVPPEQSKPQAIEEVAPELAELAAEEKELAAKVVWESRLALGMWDGPAVDSPVFIRGNPRTPGAAVPHRSLEALAGSERIKHTSGSGRLELAKQWVDPKQNPLIARVAVNRVWHHLFGRGLVPSADNFGVLGEPPTHPELLDFLANTFVAPASRDREGAGGFDWSIKRLIRTLVLTDTYRMTSAGSPEADEADPTNALLHKFRVKRLEGEAIRDAMLTASGRLDRTVGGPSVPVHLTPFMDGRGKPSVSGPTDGNGRRSLYLAVRRNFPSPFLLAFDTPIPFSTVGRRQVSNVPAQALILLNDPFVHEQAGRWGKELAKKPNTLAERVHGMYLAAFGRPPTTDEAPACAAFVAEKETDAAAWADLAHTLFNVKEFVFVR